MSTQEHQDRLLLEGVPEDTTPPDRLVVEDLPGGIRAALEAVLMVAEEPTPVALLAAATGHPVAEVEALLQSLAAEYDDQERGFELRHTVGGWRIYSRRELAPVVERFVVDAAPARLSRAALETLAIVAYRQPVTRGTISAIRGVSADGVLRTLQARSLVVEVGSDPSTGAVLFGASTELYERLGVSSVADLPPLAPYLPDLADVMSDDMADEVDAR